MRAVGDNYDLWKRQDARQQLELAQRPECTYCAESIQDDYCYEINDELICQECLESHFRKSTEDCIS